MKSIVGSKYEGNQPRGKNVVKVYEFLFYDIPESTPSIIEKIPELKMACLYNKDGEEILKQDQNKEIKVKTKSVIQAAKFNQDHMEIDANDDEIMNAIKNANVPGINAENGPKYKLKTPEGQMAVREAVSDPLAMSNNNPERKKKLDKLKEINQRVEEEKSRREMLDRQRGKESKSAKPARA